MTAKSVVIDTGVLTLYFAQEASVRPVFFDIDSGKVKGYVTSVHLCEFFYKTCEKLGETVAEIRYGQCGVLLRILETDAELSLSAGREKCHRREANLSLADCYALAASKKLGATLLTTDPVLAGLQDAKVKFFEVP